MCISKGINMEKESLRFATIIGNLCVGFFIFIFFFIIFFLIYN